MRQADFEVTVKGSLVVRLENGTVIEQPTEGELRRFGVVEAYRSYQTFVERLNTVLAQAGGATQLHPLCKLLEVVLLSPDLLDHTDMQATYDAIVEIERRLATSPTP